MTAMEPPAASQDVIKVQYIKLPTIGLVAKVLGTGLDVMQILLARTIFNPSRVYLTGDWAPVKHERHEAVQFEGKVPPELVGGVYLRNGSNPATMPVAGYHVFEGDGMVHATFIKEDGLYYCNHFMRTYRYLREQQAGWPVFHRMGDVFGLRGLILVFLDAIKTAVGYLTSEFKHGQANTSLQFYAGRVMALVEGDLPYQVLVNACTGFLQTLGRLTLGSWKAPFTAHPKLDPVTGHLHFFGYDLLNKPSAWYGELDPKGKLLTKVGVDTEYPCVMHDFVITENFAVLPTMPLIFDVQFMIKRNSSPVQFCPDRLPIFYVLPHGSQWPISVQFDSPFYVFHFANAWEEADGIIKAYGFHLEDLELDPRLLHKQASSTWAQLMEYTLNLKTCKGSFKPVPGDIYGEFPTIHPDKVGRKNKYVYSCLDRGSGGASGFGGIVKVDLDVKDGADSALVKAIDFGDDWRVGEPFFVPRKGGKEEDDGFLMLYMTQQSTGDSYFKVFDASTMDANPILSARTPQRVPPGFHGTWVEAAQLAQQLRE